MSFPALGDSCSYNYALVDSNNFFVSCEKVFNPALEGKPVVVLSGNDACVVSRSAEAKAIGIKMQAMGKKVRHFVQSHGLVKASPS